MASEISLSKELIDMKTRSNHRICLSLLIFFTSRTSLELKSLLSLCFFFKLGLLRIRGLLRYFSPQGHFTGKKNKSFYFSKKEGLFRRTNFA